MSTDVLYDIVDVVTGELLATNQYALSPQAAHMHAYGLGVVKFKPFTTTLSKEA